MQGLPPGIIPYCGSPPAPAELLSRWNLDPLLIGVLVALGGLYVAGKGPGGWRRGAFAAGWLLTTLALISPLCPLSVSLFGARVGQHMILTLVAAPLVALGRPFETLRVILPGAQLGREGGRPITAALAFAALVWFWHAPGPYTTTFLSTAVYWEMHITLFGAALWLWSELLSGRAGAAGLGASVISMLQMGMLGALITLSPEAIYTPHALTTAAWGLSPLEDQQLGGALMWVPGGIAFLAASLWLGWRLLAPRAPAWEAVGAQ
ncbi:MAG TPA: cytochrome c oxidase assembly protein [Caulobacteraceae bacterium]